LELWVLLVFADELELGSEQGLELGSSWVSLTDWNLSLSGIPQWIGIWVGEGIGFWVKAGFLGWIGMSRWSSRMDWNLGWNRD
jgi:hypothetical protein